MFDSSEKSRETKLRMLKTFLIEKLTESMYKEKERNIGKTG